MSNHFHHPRELRPPPEVLQDGQAGEVLRAWIVGGGLSVSLAPLSFERIGVWGILLVDIARHVARGCEQEGKGSYAANLEAIRELVDAEFARPTDIGTTEKQNQN
jgi:hypothetical protein